MARPFFDGAFFDGGFFAVLQTGSGGSNKRHAKKYKRPRYHWEEEEAPIAVQPIEDVIREASVGDDESDDELLLLLARVLH